jgi:hypothetical protein
MPKPPQKNEQYSEHEATVRFMTALRAAVNTPPKPLKSMTPKRPKKQLGPTDSGKTRKPTR